ncbi:hypothetical protein [Hymenobacter jeollabukensis]|uniref:Uncharacterized protein n=1 Tax=Hymenobacter jeollabukensis TaxID=2025313 RepID=A0A5R8WSU1_9BACT|nr:hypothetical protein [Hymenobacter jeollabukensis]TLM94251.1 hypothetical protein FDY95_09570 [Hymenobacter jeollabukensis]
MKTILKLVFYNKKIRTLTLFTLISTLYSILIILKLDNPFTSDIKDIFFQLITISGIFTALMFAIITLKLSETTLKRQEKISQYRADCRKIAAFQSFTHSLRYLDVFQNVHFLEKKYIRIKSYLDYRKSYEDDEETTKDIKEGRTTGSDYYAFELYGAIRDFSHRGGAFNTIFLPHKEYMFSLEKIEYLHECCNYIWYWLDKNHTNIRQRTNNSYYLHSSYWKDQMKKLTPVFANDVVLEEDKISQFLMSVASDYEQYIQKMILDMNEIIYNLSPKIILPLVKDLIIISIFWHTYSSCNGTLQYKSFFKRVNMLRLQHNNISIHSQLYIGRIYNI